MKITLAIPCYDTWEAEFGNSLALSMAALAQMNILESLRLTYVKGTFIPEARTQLAEEALSTGADYIFYLDCDMEFGPRNILTLLQRERDKYPIIGIDAWMRTPPYQKTAKYWDEERALEQARVDGRTPRTTGIEEVRAVGFGICRIDTRIFKKMKQPWFDFPWNDEAQRFNGEDIMFCEKSAKLGYKTYVDHDASQGIRHVGTFSFGDSKVDREIDKLEAA